jgi:hypothetical protein
MSDPQPARLRNKPRRAEPIQPDAPAKGQRSNPQQGPRPGGESGPAAKRRKRQSDTALENVREGYE